MMFVILCERLLHRLETNQPHHSCPSQREERYLGHCHKNMFANVTFYSLTFNMITSCYFSSTLINYIYVHSILFMKDAILYE